jgi:hypothetical protein
MGKVIIIRNDKISVIMNCRAYDPYDPLRGRYLQVTLSDQPDYSQMPSLKTLSKEKLKDLEGKEVYYILGKEGYDRNHYLKDISPDFPGYGFVYFKLKVTYVTEDGRINIKLPVFKYHIQENYALKADELLANKNADYQKYPTIELEFDNKGNYMVKQIYIGENKIEDIIENRKK